MEMVKYAIEVVIFLKDTTRMSKLQGRPWILKAICIQEMWENLIRKVI